jgi:phospholipid transport system transporter-binding protein
MSEIDYSIDGDTLTLNGLVSVETVSRYQPVGDDVLAKSESGLVVDLGSAEIVGSAPVALLIAWQRQALSQGKEYSVINAPSHFLDIARVSGVLDILPFVKAS